MTQNSHPLYLLSEIPYAIFGYFFPARCILHVCRQCLMVALDKEGGTEFESFSALKFIIIQFEHRSKSAKNTKKN